MQRNLISWQIVFVLIFSFIVAFFLQWTRWKTFDFVDLGAWSGQAEYFELGDARQFNQLGAYGHPGGTIVEGTILFHKVFDMPYVNSLVVFMTILNSLIISLVCVFCVLLKKHNFWWITTLSTLSISAMYNFSTPPTTLISPLIVLLCLLTLYFYENKEKIKIIPILFFAFVVGLSVATRADIGIFCSGVFLIFLRLKNTITWKNFFILIFSSFLFFVLFDPYMHFMPFLHIKDLISKIVFHYAEFSPTHMTFGNVFDISSLSFISVILSVVLLLMRKKIKPLVPIGFIIILILMTIFLYTVFLTSHYQAARYFMPIIFIWEVFLPLFIFNFTPLIYFRFLQTANQNEKAIKIIDISIAFLLIACQISLFCFLWIFV